MPRYLRPVDGGLVVSSMTVGRCCPLVGAHRAAHHQSRRDPQVGATPHRLPLGASSLGRAPGADPLWTSRTALAGSSDRAGNPAHGAGACGELVDVDVKKLGKIPAAGGGGCMLGKLSRRRNGHSRLAYTELLTDERRDTAAAFWLRANAWFNQC